MRWFGVLIVGMTATVAAQVPVTQEPRHRVTFENTEIRVFDVNIPPADTTLEHRHDHDIATLSMNAGTETRTQAPGQPWSQVRPRRALGHPNLSEYTGKPGSHTVRNEGDRPYHLFAVENLSKGTWSTAPALRAAATTLATESRAFRVYDVRLATERSQTSHAHAVPTVAVLVSGRVISEGAEPKPGSGAAAPVGLKQLDQPGQWVLVPRGESHHLVRIGTGDAHVVEIEIR